MKQKKTKKKNLPSIPEGKSILKPLSIEAIGSNGDPCFGLSYDLTTEECKMCGDSELCCIKFAAKMGTTRKEIESESQFKDLESLIDAKALKKTIRALKRKGEDRKTILDKLQAKYQLTKEEAKVLYKKYKPKKTE